MANDDEGEDRQGAPYPAFKPLPEGRGFPPFVGEGEGKRSSRKGKSLTASDILGQPDEAMTGSAEALMAGARIGAILPKSYLRDFEIPRSLLSDGISGRLAELSKSEGALAKLLRESAETSARLSRQMEPLKHHLEPPSFFDSLAGQDFVRGLHRPELPEMPVNPAYETNDKLDRLNEQIEALNKLTEATAQVHTQQSQMVSELVRLNVASSDALRESQKDQRHNKAIAILALVVTLVVGLPELIGKDGLIPVDFAELDIAGAWEAASARLYN